MLRVLAGGLVLALATFAPRPAMGCGALPEPLNYFTFAEPLPAPDSTGGFLDTPILLRGNAWSIGGSPIVLSRFNVETFSLTGPDDTPIEVRGGTVEWSPTFGSALWLPVEPLSPNTRYTVAAALGPEDGPRPAEATGSETLEFSFTTSAESAPPLTLDADLTVRLEASELPVLDCETVNNCGATDCRQTGTRQALMAHVTVPAVEGGVDFEGYRGFVLFTDGAPAEFAGPGGDVSNASRTIMLAESISMEASMPSEVTFEVVEEAEPYRPCFAFNVWDVRGRNVSAEPVCLESMRPSKVLAAASTAPARRPHGSAGCAVSVEHSRGPSSLSVLLALGLTAVCVRRRAHGATAPPGSGTRLDASARRCTAGSSR